MNIKIFYNLFKEKRAISPSRQFKRELWSKLDSRWETGGLPAYNWYETAWFRTSGAVFASFLGIASVGTGVYAYTSPQVNEGSSLYPVKLVLEKVEENTKITPENKARFLLKKIDRREKEKEVLEVADQKTESENESEVELETEIKETEKKIIEVEDNLEKIDKKIKDDEKNKELKNEIKKRLENRNKDKKQENKTENIKEDDVTIPSVNTGKSQDRNPVKRDERLERDDDREDDRGRLEDDDEHEDERGDDRDDSREERSSRR